MILKIFPESRDEVPPHVAIAVEVFRDFRWIEAVMKQVNEPEGAGTADDEAIIDLNSLERS